MRAHRPLVMLARALARGLFRGVFRTTVNGSERVPLTGGLLIVSNHISFVDPPIIGGLTPRPVDFMAMAELFRNPLSAAVMRALGAFPVERTQADPRAVREAVRRLRAGHCVGIFPEGGIRAGEKSILGGQPEFRPGAGMIALLGQVPILPVIVRQTRVPYDWRNWFRRGRMSVTFGAPFSLWIAGDILLHRRRQVARAALQSELLRTAGCLTPC